MRLTAEERGRCGRSGAAASQAAHQDAQAVGVDLDSWEGVDRGLFEGRAFAAGKPRTRGVPPFVVFGDATLRDLARVRPSTRDSLLGIHGIGAKKAAQYGHDLLQEIAAYCEREGLSQNAVPPQRRDPPTTQINSHRRRHDQRHEEPRVPTVRRGQERRGSPATYRLGQSRPSPNISSTSSMKNQLPTRPTGSTCTFSSGSAAAGQVGTELLRPIFDALNGEVPYQHIHIALACLRNETGSSAGLVRGPLKD